MKRSCCWRKEGRRRKEGMERVVDDSDGAKGDGRVPIRLWERSPDKVEGWLGKKEGGDLETPKGQLNAPSLPTSTLSPFLPFSRNGLHSFRPRQNHRNHLRSRRSPLELAFPRADPELEGQTFLHSPWPASSRPILTSLLPIALLLHRSARG